MYRVAGTWYGRKVAVVMMTLKCEDAEFLEQDVEPGDMPTLRLWANSDVLADCGYGDEFVLVVVEYEPEAAALSLPSVTVGLYLTSPAGYGDDCVECDWDDLYPLDPTDLGEDGPALMTAGVWMLADELTVYALDKLDALDEADERLRADITSTVGQLLRTAAELRGDRTVA